MSLLDDVSIVITPNAYNVSTLYAVIPTPILGTEEVTYPNFTNSDISQWNIASSRATKSWNASEFMRLTYDLASGSALYSSLGHTLNVVYKVTMRVRGTKADGTTAQGSAFSSIGDNNELGRAISNPALTADWQDYEFYTVPTSSTFRFYLASAVIGDLVDFDSISVKEWTGADMDVTRNTAATRVDEDGLVNYAEILGGELVTNGDFATDSLSGWTTNGDWSVVNKKATVDSSSNRYLYQEPLVQGKTYQISFEIDSIDSGLLNVYMNNPSFGSFYSAATVGYHSFEHTYGGTDGKVYFYAINTPDLTIDNISVKEVTRDNVPRIDYTGGGCPHILSEPERINLLRYSEDFSEWSVNGTSAVDGGVSSIGLNYYTITNTGGGFLGVYYGAAGISHGDTITASVYVKKGTSDDFRLRYGASINQNVDFNLDDGTIVSEGTNVVGTIQSMSDGWYRVTSTWTDATHTFNSADIALYTSSGNVEISGAQCEVGSYPTSYIPTDGTTVTRNKDIFTRDGIGSLINDSEGVLFIEMALFSDEDSNKYMSISDGTDDNKIQIDFDYSLSRLQYVVKSGTAVQVNLKLSYTGTNMDKIAFKWKENDFAVWLNGVEIGTDTLGDAPIGLNTLKLSAPAGSNNFEGKVKQLQVYDTALTDEQLLQLTGESGTDFYESYAEMAAALTYTLQ